MSNDEDKIVLLQLQLELSREETKRKQIHEEEETKRKQIHEEETKRNLAQIALQRLKLEGTFVYITYFIYIYFYSIYE